MTLEKGIRFHHSRVVNWDDRKTPALYQVTYIGRGNVYYRPVYDEGLPSERLGTGEQCAISFFHKVCLDVVSYPVHEWPNKLGWDCGDYEIMKHHRGLMVRSDTRCGLVIGTSDPSRAAAWIQNGGGFSIADLENMDTTDADNAVLNNPVLFDPTDTVSIS